MLLTIYYIINLEDQTKIMLPKKDDIQYSLLKDYCVDSLCLSY